MFNFHQKIVTLALALLLTAVANAGQAPARASTPDIPISSPDRVYLSDQTSNTVSVVDPATEKLLGVIRLGVEQPPMLLRILIACVLVVVTVAIHAVGFHALLRVMIRSHALATSGFRRVTRLVIGITCWLILIHLVEISVWGLFYFWQGCLPDAETALYFSGITYTTVGYGDLVLPKPWRMLAPLEALTGILMCGLSTGLFFAVVSRWISNWMQRKTSSNQR
jgi:YVTN family beta-propeller protein